MSKVNVDVTPAMVETSLAVCLSRNGGTSVREFVEKTSAYWKAILTEEAGEVLCELGIKPWKPLKKVNALLECADLYYTLLAAAHQPGSGVGNVYESVADWMSAPPRDDIPEGLVDKGLTLVHVASDPMSTVADKLGETAMIMVAILKQLGYSPADMLGAFKWKNALVERRYEFTPTTDGKVVIYNSGVMSDDTALGHIIRERDLAMDLHKPYMEMCGEIRNRLAPVK